MDIKNLQDALRLQQELNNKLTQQFELRENKTLSPKDLLHEKEKMLKHLKDDIVAAEKEHGLVVNRGKQQIEQRKATVNSLETQIENLRKQLDL